MPCYRPIPAYETAGGGVAFSSKEGYVDRPLSLPCGRCVYCKRKRASEWAARLMHESQMHTESCFVTLTYDDAHLPHDQGLHVEHFQEFILALRRSVSPKAVRYFHCGEYGDENLRPHYHALIFGHSFLDDRVPHSQVSGSPLYVSSALADLWGKGFCSIGEVSVASARYVARYAMKKVHPPSSSHPTVLEHEVSEFVQRYQRVDEETGEAWFVRPEYITMSRRPGIGATWWDAFGRTDVTPLDEVVLEGRKYRPPRYYDEKLPEPERKMLKRRRRKLAEKRAEDLTPERLRVRERLAEADEKRLRGKL